MRTPLDALLTERSLHFINTRRGQMLVDAFSDDALDAVEIPLKNVCAKVSQELSNSIDEIVSLLDISKRRFLEAAFIEAVQRSRAIMDAEGVWDSLPSDQDEPAKLKEEA